MAQTKRPIQATMFGPTRDRKTRQFRMRVYDAGDGDGMPPEGFGKAAHIAVFECPRCGHRTDWVWVANLTEGKRGLPCPCCNTNKATKDQT